VCKCIGLAPTALQTEAERLAALLQRIWQGEVLSPESTQLLQEINAGDL